MSNPTIRYVSRRAVRHVATDNGRTVCGRTTDGMTEDNGTAPICRTCDRITATPFTVVTVEPVAVPTDEARAFAGAWCGDECMDPLADCNDS